MGASDIGQKGHFLGKKGTKYFTTPYSIIFLSVLHQNKALHNFHKRGQCLTARCIKSLDKGLHKVYFWTSLEGRLTKAKGGPFLHEVRLTLLDNNQVFNVLGTI